MEMNTVKLPFDKPIDSIVPGYSGPRHGGKELLLSGPKAKAVADSEISPDLNISRNIYRLWFILPYPPPQPSFFSTHLLFLSSLLQLLSPSPLYLNLLFLKIFHLSLLSLISLPQSSCLAYYSSSPSVYTNLLHFSST